MKRLLDWRWTLKSRLAVLALGLGVLALFGSPQRGDTVNVNTRELAAIVEGEMDHVTVDELAGWILQGRNDYRLLDVRQAAEYAEYHIPTAESVQLTELVDYPLFRNERIVVYSGGGMHSAQAWMLLRARGYAGARILLYGLEEWKDRILFPALASDAGPRQLADFEHRSRVSRFFGGTPLTDVATAVDRPQVTMPEAPPVPTAVMSRKRKRKEGC